MKGVTYLKNSPLYNAVLKGEEIRFSDFLSYVLNLPVMHGFRLFDKEITEKCESEREKQKIDIWVSKKFNNSGINMPHIIIENKLKSLPYQEQIEEYTDKVIIEAKEQFRIYLKENHEVNYFNRNRFDQYRGVFDSVVNDLKFFILAPSVDQDIIFQCDRNIKLSKTIEYDVNKTWEIISYSTLGRKLRKHFNGKKKIVDPYLNSLLKDFVNILLSFKEVVEQIPDFNESEIISLLFTPPGSFEDLNLIPLYQKYRASQCANKIIAVINSHEPPFNNFCGLSLDWASKLRRFDQIVINNEPQPDHLIAFLEPGNIYVSHNYSGRGQAGLFEILKILGNNDIMIIQYEGNILKKMIACTNYNLHNYEDWLNRVFEDITFEMNNADNYYQYDHGHSRKFYYTRSEVDELTVAQVINAMKTLIQEDPYQ
jgi:hypothetical protein